jgi:adenylate kinase
MNIILIGPPGSGKGTQIKELGKHLDFEVIATGVIARELAKKNKEIAKTLERGELISDEILLDQIDRILTNTPKEKSLVFDGFPRNLTQAEKLEQLMLEHSRTIDSVVYIVLDEQEVVKRLAIRKICAECGTPIFEGDKCPHCGGRAINRPDDNAQTVINRMQVFLDKTTPLIEFYKNKSILKEVNGNQSIEGVAGDIKEQLGL